MSAPDGVPWSLFAEGGRLVTAPDSGPFWPEPPVDPASLIDTDCCQ